MRAVEATPSRKLAWPSPCEAGKNTLSTDAAKREMLNRTNQVKTGMAAVSPPSPLGMRVTSLEDRSKLPETIVLEFNIIGDLFYAGVIWYGV